MPERELEDFLAGVEQQAYHIAHGALWHREDAMEVVQESMLRLVQYYRDRPENQWGKLFRTILNSRINDVRRKRLLDQGKLRLISLTGMGPKDPHGNATEFEVSSPQRSDGVSSPEAETLADDLKAKIKSAVNQLSGRQRQVFTLREWQEYSVKETAQMLGCSENAVKQHHFRALRNLRKPLAEVWDHD